MSTGLMVGTSLGFAVTTKRRLVAFPGLLAMMLPFVLVGMPDWLAVTYFISAMSACATVIYTNGEFGLKLSASKERAQVGAEASQ